MCFFSAYIATAITETTTLMSYTAKKRAAATAPKKQPAPKKAKVEPASQVYIYLPGGMVVPMLEKDAVAQGMKYHTIEDMKKLKALRKDPTFQMALARTKRAGAKSPAKLLTEQDLRDIKNYLKM
jgi:hypothetical protein